MMRIYLQKEKTLDRFHEKYAVQLNDTHPSLAVAELMRLLVDEHSMEWDHAWSITTRTMGYTNHTLLPEALETWPLPLFRRLLPRHLEIIFEINKRFLATVEVRFPGDPGRVERMSLIDEHGDKRVRMANLACVGSHAVNGVAQLHSDLLKQTVLRDFAELEPEKFTNVTNGVTPRRFLLLANPGLAGLITEAIGDKWLEDLNHLRELEALCDKADFCERWRQVKHANKRALAACAQHAHGIELLPDTMFDVQVKRIHEYKRQHLNVLHAVALYRHLKRGGDAPARTIIFGGKAAPGYHTAKLIIKLIHGVAEVVNADKETNDRLRIAFLPDLNVKNGQRIYPAADLSEQISTAGMEASGTGNMKFAMNGALTIGTLDGANVEIREEVGAENFFLFGLTVGEIQQRRAQGYRPWEIYQENVELREALGLIAAGDFSRGDPALFAPIVRSLLEKDPFLLCADFQSYVDCRHAWVSCTARSKRGRACPSSTPPAWANSPRTEPFANTASTSGRWRLSKFRCASYRIPTKSSGIATGMSCPTPLGKGREATARMQFASCASWATATSTSRTLPSAAKIHFTSARVAVTPRRRAGS
jgi:starch phosphorylase